ncbi:hypothetical protein HYU95_02090 [Candidatus Daviesbacteria bacterium]|nr:hypothetical protein [Candidatus Daviesbacteria bacterium]
MKNGFSVLEVILAAAIFMIFSTGAVIVVVQSYNANRLGAENSVAAQFAAEGIEAAKSIKNQNFSLLNSDAYLAGTGLIRNGTGVWQFEGDNTSDVLTHNSSDDYTRVIRIGKTYRINGNIVESGGTEDPDTKKITSTVTWNFNSARPETTSLVTYFSDWRKPIPTDRGGILVYGDGETSSDAIKYKILDTAGTWSAAQSTADIDTGSTNKALRAARVYASSTRNEKILLSRHYNGTQQFIYAQVYNGSTWGSVQALSSWTATTFLDVQNFDGTYLSNGNFMAVYSDNTTTPKYRIWNGSSWSPASLSTANVGGIPNFVIAKVRPETAEVMMATYDQAKDSNTAYFNGSSWSATTQHASNAPVNTKKHLDFAWSPNSPFKGALIYSASASDTGMNLKIWTANGTGGGSWSAERNAPNQGVLGATDIDGRLSANEFLACNKNANNDIYCFRSDLTPAWSTPINNILTTTTDTGIQRSFDYSYEAVTGSEGLAVYSNNTATPQYKLYDATSNSFGSETQLTTALGGTVKTVVLAPLVENDDVMVLMADSLNDLFSIVWNGTANTVYTTPSGKGRSTHGTSGSDNTDFWYDFAWDKY